MASLEVYTTEGVCLYPEGGADDPTVNQYFDAVNFTVNLRPASRPTIEAYFRAILPSGRPEQLFLRYTGDDSATIYEDCRDAIHTELVESAGWQIREETDRTDPGMLLQRAVLEPATDPPGTFEQSTRARIEDLVSVAGGRTRGSVEVHGRDYEAIGDFLRTLGDRPLLVAVAEGDLSIDDADVVVRQRTQQSRISFPPATRRALASAGAQEGADIEDELGEIRATLADAKDRGAEPGAVREGLNEVLSGTFPSLEVRNRDAGDRMAGAQRPADDSPVPGMAPPRRRRGGPGRLRRLVGGLGVFTRVERKHAMGAVVVVVVIAAVLFMGLDIRIGGPGGGGNGTRTPTPGADPATPTPQPHPTPVAGFVAPDGSVTLLYSDGATASLNRSARLLSPMRDLDGDAAPEFAALTGNGTTLTLLDLSGNGTTLASVDPNGSAAFLATGEPPGGGPHSVFYVNGSELWRVAPGRSPTVVRDPTGVNTQTAGGAVGVRDFDGDGSRDLIYVANRTREVVYTNGSVANGTGFAFGANATIGVGNPLRFNGTVRVPVVVNGSRLALLSHDGNLTTVTENVVPAPMAAVDRDGDGQREILFLTGDGGSGSGGAAGNATIAVADFDGDGWSVSPVTVGGTELSANLSAGVVAGMPGAQPSTPTAVEPTPTDTVTPTATDPAQPTPTPSEGDSRANIPGASQGVEWAGWHPRSTGSVLGPNGGTLRAGSLGLHLPHQAASLVATRSPFEG